MNRVKMWQNSNTTK